MHYTTLNHILDVFQLLVTLPKITFQQQKTEHVLTRTSSGRWRRGA